MERNNRMNFKGWEDDEEDQVEPTPSSGTTIPQDNPLLDNTELLKTIQGLPAEVLEELFGHLTHTQKLISRLVCKRWNQGISSILGKKSYFLLKSDSHETFQKSTVQWKKLRICQSKLTLTTEMKNRTNTLQLEIPRLGVRECLRLVSGFHNLTNLDVKINAEFEVELHPYKRKKNKTVQARAYARRLNNQVQKCAGKLKVLSISFPFGICGPLNSFLEKFDDKKMSLTTLNIKEHDEIMYQKRGVDNDFTSKVFSTISKSSQTLKSLTLNFRSTSAGCALYSELIPKLTSLKGLKLESVWISPCPTRIHNLDIERDFLNYCNFLKSQLGTLKNMTLPRRYGTDLGQELFHCIPRGPRGFKSLEDVYYGYITEEFYTNVFQSLDFMSIISRPHGSPRFNQPCPSLRKLELSLGHYYDSTGNDTGVNFYQTLGTVFMNLVELYITSGCSFLNRHLRIISAPGNFNHMKVLQIDDGRCISDYGVTGISEEYSKESLQTRRLCIYSEPDISKQYDIHVMSSLKTLEKLVLTGTSITDFGIYYGLQFGPGLKHLTFGTTQKISDWGLHWLGAGNFGLETLDASFNSETVSTYGVENLRQQLPLLKSTKKFNLKLIENLPRRRRF